MRGRSVLGLVLLLPAIARADVLHVPKDFPTIQQAIDAAQAGDEIVIAAGSYPGTILLDTRSDLRIRGQGKVTLPGGIGALVLVQDSVNIELERLRVEGAGFEITSSAGVTLVQCRATGGGVVVQQCDSVVLDHVRVEGATVDGVLVQETVALTLRHCTILDSASYGIEVEDGSGHLLDHVRIEGAGEDGIFLGGGSSEGVQESLVRKCVIEDASLNGIAVRGTGVLVEDNRVLQSSSIGVRLLGGACIARDNRVTHAGEDGFNVAGSGNLFTGNRAKGSGELDLIDVSGGANTYVDNHFGTIQID